MARRQQAPGDRGPAPRQRVGQAGAVRSSRILGAENHEDGRPGEVRRRRIGQNRLRAEEDRQPHPPRHQVQERGREIRTIRIADEHHPRRLEPVGVLCLLQEGGEGLGLETDIGLVEVLRPLRVRGGAPEPARPSLLQAPPAQRQDRGARRGAPGKRNEVGLLAPAAVQQDEGVAAGRLHRAVRPFGQDEPVDEAKVAVWHPPGPGQGQLRQAEARVLPRRAGQDRGQHQSLAERRLRFVDEKARPVGGELQQDIAGIAHVERTEVVPVVQGRRLGRLAEPCRGGGEARRIRRAERDMVGSPRPGTAGPEAGGVADVHRISLGADEPGEPCGGRLRGEAELAGEEGGALRRPLREQGHAPQPQDRLVGRHLRRGHGRARRSQRRAGDLDDDAVRIAQPQDRLAELGDRPLGTKTGRQRPGQPAADRGRGHREGDLRDLPVPDPPRRPVLPGEEGDERAGAAERIAIEEMQLGGILEAGRPLDEPEPEKAEVEIDIRLEAPGDQGDVVEAARHRGHPRFAKVGARTSG